MARAPGPHGQTAAGWRPPAAELERALARLEPWRRLTRPVFSGLEHIPAARPLLFVGNHTLFGVLDVPLLFAELYRTQGIFLRALGDHLHFRIPVWRDLLMRYGAVDGTRENCARLLEAGEAVLVFPGGGREVAKRKGEKYQLIWKERLGFARMAIRHGCPIVPFAAVGAEDAYEVLLDAGDLSATPVGRALQRLGVRLDVVPPLVRGLGPTPLPRPQRLYFQVGEPIETAGLSAGEDEQAAARALRDQVKQAVEASIAALRRQQAADPQRVRLRRLLGEAPDW